MRKDNFTPVSCVIVRAVMVKQRGGVQIPIEIGIEKYERGCLVEEYSSFCKPDSLVALPQNMPSYITSEVLRTAPAASIVAEQIRNMVGTSTLIGECAELITEFANLQNKDNKNVLMM